MRERSHVLSRHRDAAYTEVMRILVVEDFPPLRMSLARGLREAGYAVDAVSDGNTAFSYAEAHDFDVIVLDIMLPGMDGLALLERLRSRHHPAQVLLLTARDTVEDRVNGLDRGADDYLVKPFAFDELLARVRALVRRRHTRPSPEIHVDDLVVDTAARRVTRGGKDIDLTAREYSILEVLALRTGQTLTRDEISDAIYDFAEEHGSNVVDVYIGYIRKKLRAAGDTPLIHTRRGLGYMLKKAD